MSNTIGLVGLAVMGQNLALNIAEKGFKIGVYNRTLSKVDDAVRRAADEGNLPLTGYQDMASFVAVRRRHVFFPLSLSLSFFSPKYTITPLLSTYKIIMICNEMACVILVPK